MSNLLNRTFSAAKIVTAKLALDRVVVLGVLSAYILSPVNVTAFTGTIVDAGILGVLLTYGALVCLLPLLAVELAIDGMFKVCGSSRRTYQFHIGALDMATINLVLGSAITLTAVSVLPFTRFHVNGVGNLVAVSLLFSLLIDWMNSKVRPGNHHS